MVTPQDGPEEPLIGNGIWNNCTNLDQFSAALTAMHVGVGWNEERYVEHCERCLENLSQEKFHCDIHVPTCFQPRPTGNIVHSLYFKSCRASARTNSKHNVKRSNQLLPTEVKAVGRFCRQSGNLVYLMLYTVLLVGIELYLRREEFKMIDDVSVIWDSTFMAGENLINSLMLHLRKKISGSAQTRRSE